MKEQVYVRVMAHNAAGWGAPTLSTPRHFAIADDEKAPGSSSRRGFTSRFIATFLSRIVRFALILGVCAAIIALFYYCYVCMSSFQHNQRGAYQPVPQIIDDPSVVESVRLDRAVRSRLTLFLLLSRVFPWNSIQ